MEYHVTLPLTDEFVKSLKIDDVLYISGTVITARDQVHKTIQDWVKNNSTFPKFVEDILGSAIYHCGPLIIKDSLDQNSWVVKSAGPTTSARMNPFYKTVAKALKSHIVIGKGGMNQEGWGEIPAVYCIFPGGVGALAAKFIEKIIGVEMLEFGIPEALWIFECKEFGPLLVSIDTHGNSIFKK
jgi:tartrate/fumarate subfamily iron-sulfur-dependent hydro-lyase beta chain